MKPLVELPDRKGKIKLAVSSDKLVGTTVDWYGGKKYEVTKDKTDWKANPVKVSIKDWVEYMLPPQGLPGKTEDQVKQAQANDATVVNWKWDGTLALNEPETPHKWADYESPTPLEASGNYVRSANRETGVPLAPSTSWKAASVCTESWWSAMVRTVPCARRWNQEVRSRPGRVNRGHGVCVRKILRASSTRRMPLHCRLRSSRRRPTSAALVDPIGMIFVLHEEEAEVRKNPKKQLPLVIRGNVYDCVDIIYQERNTGRCADRMGEQGQSPSAFLSIRYQRIRWSDDRIFVRHVFARLHHADGSSAH